MQLSLIKAFALGHRRVGPKPRTTKPAPGLKICLYLLRGLTVEQLDPVWRAGDSNCIPVGRGFPVAIMGWASWAVLAWRLSNIIVASFCALGAGGTAGALWSTEIFDTDQGAQFTAAFSGALMAAGVCISMGGRGG